MAGTRRIAIVGAGWAGLAAAVRAVQRGHAVTLFEMAPQAGGRARSLAPQDGDTPGGERLDNGQHILIGAYAATLGLMRSVGVDLDAVLLRQPLALLDEQGRGLRLRAGHPLLAFARAVLTHQGWSWGERLALLASASGWMARGFRCDEGLSVAALTATMPARLRRELIEPLCVAALNTPADAASASVFLRVLHPARFTGPGASELQFPRRPRAALLPEPAIAWLREQGAKVHLGQRVSALASAEPGGWRLDGERFDAVVLACSASEAARLARAVAPAWADLAAGLRYEPILTAYVQAPGARLAAPMIALAEGPQAPAQFAFDHGALGGPPGRFAYVVSGAAPWVAAGQPAAASALLAQARATLRGGVAPQVRLLRLVAEKRATFRCVPGLQRSPAAVAAGLVAAGDHVQGPYPATLEGAVRSGLAALDLLDARNGHDGNDGPASL